MTCGLGAETFHIGGTLATAPCSCITDRRSQGLDTVGSLPHAPPAMAPEFNIGSSHHHLPEMKPLANDRLTHLHHHDAGLRRGHDDRIAQPLQTALGDLAHGNAVGRGQEFRTSFDLSGACGRLLRNGLEGHRDNLPGSGCLDKSTGRRRGEAWLNSGRRRSDRNAPRPSVSTMRTSDERLSTWNRNGWLVVDGAIDDSTLGMLRTAVEELTSWATTGGPGLHHFEQTAAGPALARSERFADVHDQLGSFVRSGVVPDVVAGVLEEPATLFKEKVNYKLPGGAGFAAHQDAAAYRFVDHHISVMVPIDPATVDNGCLWFAPGHRAGKLATDDRGRLTDDVVASLDWQPVEVEPGQLVAFDSYAPHRSETNQTNTPRRTLYLTYNAASRGDFRDRYYADKDAEFAASGSSFASGSVRISISDDFLGRPVQP